MGAEWLFVHALFLSPETQKKYQLFPRSQNSGQSYMQQRAHRRCAITDTLGDSVTASTHNTERTKCASPQRPQTHDNP